VTLPSNEVPELDIARVSAAYRRRVDDVCPGHRPLAIRTLDRLDPARWTLEWYLPWWLGHAFGLDGETAGELVLSNVLGLASIRLQDDLADGEVASDDVVAAEALSAALHGEALAPYRARFLVGSSFWDHLDSCMSAWRAATFPAASPAAAGGPATEPASANLAARGAPLRISAFAVCLLTGRVDAYPVLARCLDHALAALVLYDHLGDWRADLAAGRWNAFVAAASELPQTPANRDANRAGTLLGMLNQDAVAKHVERIRAEATLAAELSEGVRSCPLTAYLRGFAARAEEEGSALQAHYRDVAERAAGLLLGASLKGRSWDGRAAAALLSTIP
jgi:hypothetical protein